MITSINDSFNHCHPTWRHAGKTAIMVNRLKNMDAETMASYTINMNSFSDAPSLQVILEQPLEKKSGGAHWARKACGSTCM